MASSSSFNRQGQGFAELASQYRIFYLEDLLAEPQELVHDSYRDLLYISQRCLQGHASSPVTYAAHISILDISSNLASQGTFSTIDITPYGGPHGMEMDETCAYLYLDVETDGKGAKGTVCVDLAAQAVVGFAPLSGSSPLALHIVDLSCMGNRCFSRSLVPNNRPDAIV
jgi:hypothetical protein